MKCLALFWLFLEVCLAFLCFGNLATLVIAWSARKGFNQLIRRTKEQKTRLQCLPSAMPKPVMPSGAMKSAKLLRRKSARIWQC